LAAHGRSFEFSRVQQEHPAVLCRPQFVSIHHQTREGGAKGRNDAGVLYELAFMPTAQSSGGANPNAPGRVFRQGRDQTMSQTLLGRQDSKSALMPAGHAAAFGADPKRAGAVEE